MSTGSIIALVVTIVIIAAIGAGLYFLGKKAKKRQEEQQVQIDANKQTMSMLIIDKKRLKIKDSGLPQAVIAQTPKLMRGSKLPIVKVKVGPQVMNLVCDEKIFDSIPVKKEVKAVVSGIYITEVRGYRTSKNKEPEKKKGFWASTWAKAKEKAGVQQVK
ncbi:MAG: hypothetical protein J6K58_06305 [Lachnospiraceae bacterium]|nr:hypothetical protein [Lachnospiraceae bacterium]